MIKINSFTKTWPHCLFQTSGGHVGLEDLRDGVDVGRCPDVQTKVHPDNDLCHFFYVGLFVRKNTMIMILVPLDGSVHHVCCCSLHRVVEAGVQEGI